MSHPCHRYLMRIRFEASVPTQGFAFVSALRRADPEGKREKYLVIAVAPDEDPPPVPSWKARSPLQQTGLFRTFIDLRGSSDGKILDFADQHGFLLAGEQREMLIRADLSEAKCERIGSYFYLHGERLLLWRNEIRDMRQLVEVWDALRSKDSAALANKVHRTQSKTTERVTVWFGNKIVAPRQSHPDRLGRIPKDDILIPSMYFLLDQMAVKIEANPLKAATNWSPGQKEPPQPQLEAVSLCGALWLQFWHAVTGDHDYRRCEQCMRWFEVGANTRADAKYCRDACKSRAYRSRRDRARTLRAQGASLRAIARELESEIKTVKKWVSE